MDGPKAVAAAVAVRKRRREMAAGNGGGKWRREMAAGFCIMKSRYVAGEAFLSDGYVTDFVLTLRMARRMHRGQSFPHETCHPFLLPEVPLHPPTHRGGAEAWAQD